MTLYLFWLLLISRTHALYWMDVSHVCFIIHLKIISLGLIQNTRKRQTDLLTLQMKSEWNIFFFFYQKSNHALLYSRKGHEIRFVHYKCMNFKSTEALILNGDSRCHRMYMPSLILIRCHNQLLLQTTTKTGISQNFNLFCFHFSRCWFFSRLLLLHWANVSSE